MQSGNFDVTVVASNGINPDATQSFTINVQTSSTFAPIITSTPITTGTVGQLYTYDVKTDGNPAITYSLTVAPSGMTINPSSGIIQWTPSSEGDFNVTVNAANGISPDATQSFTINVQAAPFAPIITSTPVTNGVVGQLYTYDVETDGNPAITYSLTVAPSGMTINPSSGIIQWTPSSAGDFNVTVNAANGINPDATQSFTINVQAAPFAPTITSTPVTNGVVSQLYTYDVNASGNPTPTYSLTQNPSGMTINPTSGLIEWTPGSTGDFGVTVNATNGINPDATQSFTINVIQPLIAPSSLTAIKNPVDTTNVLLNWIDNSTNELGYVIERKTGDLASSAPFEILDSVSADETSYEDATVEDTTTYTYRIRAFDGSSFSDYSNLAEVITPVPVELTTFVATVINGNVMLAWETATELNNSGVQCST